MSCVTMTYDTKWSGNIIKTLEINDLSEITCYFANLVFIFADCRNLKIKLMIIYSGGNQHLHQCKTRNISFKCCSKHKSRDSFGFCSS